MIPQTSYCYPVPHLIEEKPDQDEQLVNRVFPVQADEMLKSVPLSGLIPLLIQELEPPFSLGKSPWLVSVK